MDNAAERFNALNYESYIFTKMDETEKCGVMLNQILRRKRPVAYITNGNSNSFYNSRLIYRDIKTGKEKTIDKRVRFSLSWSPDGNQIAYASNNKLSKNKTRYYDIYTYNISTGKRSRITERLRAHSPGWSPDGKRLAFVMSRDGTDNIGILDPGVESGLGHLQLQFAKGRLPDLVGSHSLLLVVWH